MPTGAQGEATGLAKQVAEFVRDQLAQRGISSREFARLTGMSHNYIAKRLRLEGVFNVKDLAAIAKAFDIPANEIVLRAQYGSIVANYEGRLIPEYSIAGDKDGIHIYRSVDVDPPMRDAAIGTNDTGIKYIGRGKQQAELTDAELGLVATDDDNKLGSIDGEHTEG